MKKFESKFACHKKVPLDLEEHEEFAAALREAQKLLEPWVERFHHAYSVNGKEVKELRQVLRLLSSTICCTQDNHWYAITDKGQGHNCPYYGKGKVAWI